MLRSKEFSVELRSALFLQFLGEQLIHQLWIRLPLGKLHHLSHEKSQHGCLARAVLLELLGIGRENFLNNFFES